MGEKFRRLLDEIRLSSVILILIGAVLLLRPDSGAKALTLIVGWILVIAGGIGVAGSVFSRMAFGYGTMGSSLIMLLLGILIVSRPLMLASLFGVVIGAYLVFSGLGSLGDAGRLRANGQSWVFGMIWGGVSVIVGVGLILSPMTSSRLVMMLAGLVMIVCGVGSIVTRVRLKHFLQERERQSRPYRDCFGVDEDDIIDV